MNKAVSGVAVIKMRCLSNKSVDEWREKVKTEKRLWGGGGTADSVSC